MKKQFFFLFVTILLFGSMSAQEPDSPNNHYQNPGNYENNMTLRAKVFIDGIEQQSINVIEIGAFDNNNVTASGFVKTFTTNEYYRVNLTIGGNNSYAITFRLYDHSTNQEYVNYTITDPNGALCNGINWASDANLGTWAEPYILNFFTPTFTKTIAPYTAKGGWYLISSPIGEVAPENVTNLTSENFDLYRFNQSADKEWENYKQEGDDHYHFNLEPGKGYLYSNSNNVTLTFAGMAYCGTGEVDLIYDENAIFQGWNLIGNPYSTDATLDRPYYRLNSTGDALNVSTETTSIAAMEGVFVQATAATQKATFNVSRRDNGSRAIAQVNLTVNSNRNRGSIIDNVILRFDGGNTLEKYSLHENGTKLYITQNGKDYAVVNANNQNVIPVNFKAAENGTYTLSFNTEGVTMYYLHLIDHITGNDVDLLKTPSYTFNAKTNDYASRFKLVFATSSNSDN